MLNEAYAESFSPYPSEFLAKTPCNKKWINKRKKFINVYTSCIPRRYQENWVATSNCPRYHLKSHFQLKTKEKCCWGLGIGNSWKGKRRKCVVNKRCPALQVSLSGEKVISDKNCLSSKASFLKMQIFFINVDSHYRVNSTLFSGFFLCLQFLKAISSKQFLLQRGVFCSGIFWYPSET